MSFDNNSFYAKNLYRKYPLQKDSNVFPDTILADLKVSCLYADRGIYISKAGKQGDTLFLSVSSNISGLELCSFTILKAKSFNSYSANNHVDTAYSRLVVGDVNSWPEGIKSYNYQETKLEESNVHIYTRPTVTALDVKGEKVTGEVVFSGDNIELQTASPNLNFSVLNNSLILSDADQSINIGTCDTPFIRAINNVLPDGNGNIDIYGISPLQITTDAPNSKLVLTVNGISLDDYCEVNRKNIPPTNTTSSYPTIDGVTQLEIYSWPQYI